MPETLTTLIKTIAQSTGSTFYRDMWVGSGNVESNGEYPLSLLPHCTVARIASRPFQKRLYVREGLYVKIAYHGARPYLIAKTKEHIAEEYYGPVAYERPLVCFQNPQESIEKGLWVYAQHLLPLVAEDNLAITLMAAARYQIDALIGDVRSLKTICADTSSAIERHNIRSVIAVDSFFGNDLKKLIERSFPNAAIHFVLALPETGPLAHLCPESTRERPVFHPDRTMHMHNGAEELVVTRLTLLPTPIVKYDTAISIRREEVHCACTEPIAFSLIARP